jgi:phosphatidate cytidylyltransferase
MPRGTVGSAPCAPDPPAMASAPSQGNWSDLTTRVVSAAAMAAVGAGEILLGGIWFQMLVVFVCAVMVWELSRMIRPSTEISGMLLAALTASVLSGVLASGLGWRMALMLIVPVLGAIRFRQHAVLFFAVALYVQLGGWALVHFRNSFGLTFVLWLLAVVIVTDILGYFAGRLLGGPKFWPRVSPKKTWSGTIAGWFGAALVGFAFAGPLGLGWLLIPVSVLISFAGQMGDIGESALKRFFGVKDSSDLIPGHGGVFDRFDALMGACVVALFLTKVVGWLGSPL